jgi:ABC-2 type transport system permease protein
MIAIIKRTLKNRKTSTIVYSLGIMLFSLMYVSLFPTMKEAAGQLAGLMEAFPEGFMAAFGIEDIALMFESLEGFMAGELFSFIWPIMVIFMMVSLAASSIAGEAETGTIEIQLSQPISRVKNFFGQYLAGLIILLSFVLISVYSIILLAMMFNVEYAVGGYHKIAVLGFLFGFAVYGISLLISSILSEKGKANFLAGGILILMYVLNIVAALKDSLSDLKYFSFFYYFNVTEALVRQNVDTNACLVFGVVGIISVAMAAFWFNRRDIAS